ncbi:MAG: diaminopimelate epimerase [Gaiellaceae bacterium]|nr:MAG: diaminopimelate epimerase [Gaiellaceae bacterium]
MRSSTWQALGNVYVLVEPRASRLDAEAVRSLVGEADGVLEVVAHDDEGLEVVIWNPDGSRAELSGNGTRIAASWHFEQTGTQSVRVLVAGRSVAARRLDDGLVEQELGPVQVAPPEVIGRWTVTPVSVGNPHAVVLGDPAEIATVGPALERHERFPERTNVQVARIDGPGVVTARVWERGVGETASSGTSAVAVAAATHGEGEVLVRFPGGDLRVRIHGGRAFLIAPLATRVA